MARFRRKARKVSSRIRSFFRRGKSSNSGESLMQLGAAGASYGAFRADIANLASPITNMIPAGNLSDEVGLGVSGYLVAKNTSGFWRSLGKAALVVESARVGETIRNGGFSLGGQKTSGSQVMFG